MTNTLKIRQENKTQALAAGFMPMAEGIVARTHTTWERTIATVIVALSFRLAESFQQECEKRTKA